ncbi:MAG: GNAT family N-acetyltransferase [Actinomycetota bacterium]|nr:GNAT family N-acetyltransferase [Actinomycetota bacterium]MDQ2958332.1 GNAT family N-acetyltransferase [Actinomycetota bacterium]
MSFTLSRPDGLTLSDDPSRIELDRCVRWLATSYWASDRTPEQIARSLAGSRVFGVYEPDGTQLALTRAVTDGATFCWISDVFVEDAARGRGIGTWLVGTVVEQLKLEGVPRFLLGTRDAHGMYAKLGFIAPLVPEVYMELDDRPTRPTRENVDPTVLSRDSSPVAAP